MAQQGLFTQGLSVDDLLQQRNKSATDLQQQLMQNAARGARDPAKAQAVSFLGSSLGRALGSAVGGEDEILAKRQAEIDAQKTMQQDYATSSQGTGATQKALAERLMKAGFYQEAAIVSQNAKATFEEEAAALKLEQDEIAAAAKLKVQKQNNNRLADRVMSVMPKIAESATFHQPTLLLKSSSWIMAYPMQVSSQNRSQSRTWTNRLVFMFGSKFSLHSVRSAEGCHSGFRLFMTFVVVLLAFGDVSSFIFSLSSHTTYALHDPNLGPVRFVNLETLTFRRCEVGQGGFS